jgi:hypothetical protein
MGEKPDLGPVGRAARAAALWQPLGDNLIAKLLTRHAVGHLRVCNVRFGRDVGARQMAEPSSQLCADPAMRRRVQDGQVHVRRSESCLFGGNARMARILC